MAWKSISRFRWGVALAIVTAGFLAYSNSFTGGFLWDDVSSVLLHRHVQDPLSYGKLFSEDQHAFVGGEGNFYRPLVSLSFAIDFLFANGGPNPDTADPDEWIAPEIAPFLFHLSNTIWHIAAALLLFLLLIRLDAPRVVQAAVPLVYVVHPLHTEAVSYISGRADPMAAVFMYAGLLCALWRGPLNILGGFLSLGCFIAALMSKESAMIYPALLFLCLCFAPDSSNEARPTGKRLTSRIVPLAGAVAILLGYGLLRMTSLSFGSPGEGPAKSYGARILEVGQAFALYLKLLLVPTNLHMERTLAGASVWLAAAGFVLLFALIALTVYAIKNGKKRLALGLLWFLASWLPISGIFPLNAPMAEHWMYVPMAGLLLALFELPCLIKPQPALAPGPSIAHPIAAVMALAGFVIFTPLTVVRNLDWQSNESLYRATLKDNPASARIQFNLAVTYDDLLDNAQGARRHYEKVIALYAQRKSEGGTENERFWDDEIESHLSLGRIYLRQKNYAKAAEHFSTLLRLPYEKKYWDIIGTAAFGLGQISMTFGDFEQARNYLGLAKEARPALQPQADAMLQSMGSQPS